MLQNECVCHTKRECSLAKKSLTKPAQRKSSFSCKQNLSRKNFLFLKSWKTTLAATERDEGISHHSVPNLPPIYILKEQSTISDRTSITPRTHKSRRLITA